MLGEWLRLICKERRLSLRQAEKIIGISHSTVNFIMRGHPVNLRTVQKLAKAFGDGECHRRALEDKLMVMAGFRQRPIEVSEAVGRLLDGIGDFSDDEFKILAEFADYLKEIRSSFSGRALSSLSR